MGQKIAAGSALVLFIALFLPWYGVKVKALGASVSLQDSASAWEAFGFIDILLFLAAATVIAVVAAGAAGALPELPVPAGMIILGAGGLALLLVLFRLIDSPAPNDLPEQIDITRKFGIFVGLLAAGGMVYGGSQASKGG